MTTLLLRNTRLFILLLPLAISPAQPQLSVGTFVHDPASGKEYRAYDGSLALIVGVDTYTQVEARRSSVSSALSIKELLMSRFGFQEQNIVILLNDQARLAVIRAGLGKLRRRSPSDRVFIFLSGRGYTERDELRNERGFFIPFDGVIQSPEQAAETCLPLDELKESVSAMGVMHALVSLDFTVGGLPVMKRFSGIPPLRLGFERIVTLPARELMVAGDRIETVVDDPSTGLSFFASKLIETLSSDLADINGDGIISGTELAGQTSVKVSAASERKMHPQFGFMTEGSGDYLLILPHPRDTSRIFFTFKPADAILFIDEKQVKPSDLGLPVASPKIGTHAFQIQCEGYRTVREEFFVDGRVSLRANIELMKIPTSDLLVRISEPDARIYVDGKFVGIPDPLLVIERIGKGTHKVRADLEGYFSDSTTVTTDQPIQYAVNLKLRSRNGFLTIRSSEGVVIEWDAKVVGTKEVVKKEVLPGPHTVQLSGIGYTRYKEDIMVRDTESVEFIHPMARPSLAGALWRSAVFPGWGQSYSGRRGIFYSLIFTALAAASIDLQLSYMKTNNDYNTNLKKYNAATNATDISTYGKKVSDLKKKRKNLNLYRYAAFGVTGGFYLYNIINVWGNDPSDLLREEQERARKGKGKAKMSLELNEFGPAITLSLSL
jgi:hypothetical protein